MERRLWHLVGLILVGVLPSTQASREKARIVTAEEGKSITVKCSTTKNAASMHLYQRMALEKKVLYYFRNPPKCTPEDEYVDRVKTEGEMVNLSVTITNVTDDDSGLYWCSYNMIQDLNLKKFTSSFTLVVVNADLKPCPPAEPVPTPPCHLPMTSLRVIITICAGSVVLLNVVILLICLGLKMTKARGKKKNMQYNEIYEGIQHCPSLTSEDVHKYDDYSSSHD